MGSCGYVSGSVREPGRVSQTHSTVRTECECGKFKFKFKFKFLFWSFGILNF